MSELGAVYHCAVSVPRLRLARSTIAASLSWLAPPNAAPAAGTRAVCNWDEDALTLGVEAARRCLGAARQGGTDSHPETVLLCSTTSPFEDRDTAVVLAEALDLPESTATLNLGASMRVATSGLLQALCGRGARQALVVASEARTAKVGSPQELTYGDAAAALLVGPAGPGALATVLAAHQLGADFVDHFRLRGSDFDYALEERWTRDEFLGKLIPRAVAELLASTGTAAESVRHFAVPVGPATAKRLAQSCGLSAARREDRVYAECGDAGAAWPALLLAGCLEAASPGELIVLLGIGQGVDVLLLRAESAAARGHAPLGQALADGRDEASYVRYLSHRGLVDVDFGMRAERDQRTAHTVAYRRRGALNAFKGGRCTACATVQFPRSRVCVNPECRATDTQVDHRLADSTGRVKSFTEDWQAYAARPPYVYGNVEFAEGGNLLMEFTDVEPGAINVNDAVRFVFRIKDEDRARRFRRYFWKAAPVRGV